MKAQTDNVSNISNEIDFLILKSANGQAELPTLEQTNEWLMDYVKQNVDEENLQMFVEFSLTVFRQVLTVSHFHTGSYQVEDASFEHIQYDNFTYNFWWYRRTTTAATTDK